MKKLLLFTSIMLITIIGKAADFVIDGISYNVLSWSELTLEVTQSETSSGESTYSGDIIIPGKIESGGNTFTVVSIGSNAFWHGAGYSRITSITIPNTIRTIKQFAFVGCDNLKKINLPNSIITIEDYAFYGCRLLNNTELPNSLMSIGNYAFLECENIEEISIPNSVTTLGQGAFSGCKNLLKITIGSGISTIEESTFASCKLLNTIVLPEGLKTIENNAFGGCDALTKITIPNSVTDIKPNFQYCKNLNLLVLGESVLSIDLVDSYERASTSLTIVCLNPTPPSLNINSDYIKKIPIFIPTGSLNAYSNSKAWRGAQSITEGLPSNMNYPVNTNSSGKGFVLSCGNYIEEGEATSNIQMGTRIPIVAIPNDGYTISSLKINGNEVSDKIKKYTYIIDSLYEATTISVEFDSIPKEITSTLNLDVSEGGFIEVKDNNITNEKTELEIPMGNTCLFVIPNDGYRLNTFFVDGDDMTDNIINHQYKFISTGEKISVKATFKKDNTADVNKDGFVNAADVVSIYNYIINGE